MNAGDFIDGRYRVERLLGEGGMGSVWLAADTVLGKRVAIKTLLPSMMSDLRAVEQLKREVRTAQELRHENICATFDFRESRTEPYLVMEYVDGETLTNFIYRQPGHKCDERTFRHLARQILAAVGHAHRAGVIHRDLKSANVMVARDGSVRVMDFGIAANLKETHSRSTGTPVSLSIHYASPEQINGDAPSTAMDVYSLGCVFYEMLSGSPPFHQGDILHQQLTKIPGPIPDVSNEVNQAVLGCLVKDPRRRLKTVEEVEAALAGNRTVKIDRPGTAAAQSKLVPVLLGAAALLAVVGLVVWSRMDAGGDRLKGGSERAIEIPAPAAPPVQTEAAPPVRNITPEFSGNRAAPPQTAEAPRPRRPDISAQLEAARQAHADGEYQRAINIYREALRLAPESTEAQRGLAAAIRARDAESITSPASLVAGHVAEGNRFHAAGDYVRAMEAFQQALAADPQNAQARAGYEKSRKAQAALEAAGIKE